MIFYKGQIQAKLNNTLLNTIINVIKNKDIKKKDIPLILYSISFKGSRDGNGGGRITGNHRYTGNSLVFKLGGEFTAVHYI